jgi:HSP20 family protein
MDEFRRRMDRLFEEYDWRQRGTGRDRDQEYLSYATFPRINLVDAGSQLVVKAELPGLADKDVKLTLNQDVLTIEGERKSDAPEGFSVHRQERNPVRFTRSFTLPCRVDAEKTGASMKDGILTVTLSKAPEAQPRQISVRAQ